LGFTPWELALILIAASFYLLSVSCLSLLLSRFLSIYFLVPSLVPQVLYFYFYIQVDAIGRRTDAEAAQSRYEKEIASLKAEAQAQLEAAVHDAVSAKHAAMEGLIAEREAAMDAAYAKHLNDTIAQQNQAQVTVRE